MQYLAAVYDPSDFACSCGQCKTPPDIVNNLRKVHEAAVIIQHALSEECDIPEDKVLNLVVLSGYRCHSHNVAVGGAQFSQHLVGKALDIACHEVPMETLAHIVDRLQSTGKILPGGLGRYPDSHIKFVHFDIRGHVARWTNSRKGAAVVGTDAGVTHGPDKG